MANPTERLSACFDCDHGDLGFPCRDGAGRFLFDKVALAYRNNLRHESDPDDIDDCGPDAWAFDCVLDLVQQAPAPAFEFILRSLEVCENNDDLSALAAGPLEDLLRHHADTMIDRIEAEAARSERFRLLLSGVWGQRNIRPEIWQRLQTAVQKGPWLDDDPRTPQGSRS